jgi:hypothetical protein
VFDCPKNARLLAFTELTACQAFVYQDNTYGLLFHMESTAAMIRDMIQSFEAEWKGAGFKREDIEGGIVKHLNSLHAQAERIFDRWAGFINKGIGVQTK